MKVLAIMGSPRRNGSGSDAVDELEAAMRRRGDVVFERIHLLEHGLGLCRGCFLCISKGEGLCPMNADRRALQERMEAADAIVLVSPSYVQNVSWPMKNFIDRFAFTHHRPILLGKKVMSVANGGAGMKRVRQSLDMAIEGPDRIEGLDYMVMPWPMSPKAVAKRDAAVEKAAGRLHAALVKGDVPPTFSKYLMFRFFKGISEETGEYLPADRDYYRDREDYHYPLKVGFMRRTTAGALFRLMTKTMKDMAPYGDE